MTTPGTETRREGDREQREERRQRSEQQAHIHDSSQRDFTELFSGMTSEGAPGDAYGAQLAWQAYFDQADQTLRTSRRVTEALFIGNLRQQIVADVRAQVLRSLRSDIQGIRDEVQRELVDQR